MDTATINWAKGVITWDHLGSSSESYLKEAGFYAILAGTLNPTTKQYEQIKLLYIGQAYEQTLGECIPQPHAGYECINAYAQKNPSAKILVMVGVLTQTNRENITQQFFNDIECCLIFRNQPLCNTLCEDSYSGRNLSITNTGDFNPLAQSCVCGKAK